MAKDGATSPQALSWQSFSSISGDYFVDLPGSPAEQTSTSLLLGREIQWQMTSVTLPALGEGDLFEYYLVAYADVPRSLSYDFSQKAILDAATDSIVNDFNDEQLKQTLKTEEIAFQGLPARLLTGEGLGQFVAATLSMANGRLYLMVAIDDDRVNFEHFFNSFSLTP